MPYPLPLTRTEAYLAYKAGVIQQSDLKPSLAVPRNGIDAWLAYWTGLAEDYPKREDGTPHILQEEEAYIAYLCGVINEYPEKCLRRVGAYLRYIISARWGRPDHPLNREELYLSLIKTQFIPSGDPSSDIVIDGTVKAPFVDVKMYGDTLQNGTPTPEEPVPIQTVTGEQVVEVQGKNLFDKNHPNDSKCYVNASGVLASGGNQNLSVYIKCEPNTTYTVSKSNKGTNNRFCVFNTEAEPAIGVSVISTVGTRVGEDNSSSYTITTGANARYLGVFYRAAATTPSESEIKDTIQIEKGSTATNYEPYSSNDYEINLGKNLFNKNDVVNGIPSSTDGRITSTSSIGRTSDYIPVMSDTDYSHTGHPLGWATVAWYKADKSFIRRDDNITTITSPSEATYARVSCALGNLDTCQFEAGEPTSYAPYFEPIELNNLDDTYLDYIWEDGEDWKLHKATNKILVDGTENWAYPDSGDNYTFFQLSRANFITKYGAAAGFYASNTEVGFAKADKFEQIVAAAANMRTKQGIGFSTEGIDWFRISVASTIATTIEVFKAWLAENVTTVLYALETPTDTVITDQNLIDQLNALKQGGAEEGTTYIKVSATDPNLPAKLYVEAPKYD